MINVTVIDRVIFNDYLYLADNIAVRELLNVANFFYEALQLARKGGDNNEPSLYGFGGQVNLLDYLYKVLVLTPM
jgi:hypothetical protein